MPEPTTPVRVPELTEEQREQMRQAMANVTAGIRQIAEAFVPFARAAAEQLTQVTKLLQEAGCLDEDGNPTDRVRMEIHVRPDPPNVAEAIRDIRRFGTPPRRT